MSSEEKHPSFSFQKANIKNNTYARSIKRTERSRTSLLSLAPFSSIFLAISCTLSMVAELEA